MNIVQIAHNAPPNKEFTMFCNTLRCPLCNSQLDGNIHPKEAKLYCVGNNDEYKCIWHPEESTPIFEIIKYYYSQYIYEIIINRRGINKFETRIDRLNTDAHVMHRERTRRNVFHLTGDRILFFRRRMDEELFLKKLKTYNVFS
jgi:hypothetical protein